jgi:hypothetical protein
LWPVSISISVQSAVQGELPCLLGTTPWVSDYPKRVPQRQPQFLHSLNGLFFFFNGRVPHTCLVLLGKGRQSTLSTLCSRSAITVSCYRERPCPHTKQQSPHWGSGVPQGSMSFVSGGICHADHAKPWYSTMSYSTTLVQCWVWRQ